jgi:hypothetical protein
MADANSSIIYCDNGPYSDIYCAVFSDVVRSLGLRPVFYSGVGANIRNSSLDRELRDNFYNAGLAVVRLAGEDPLDN